MIAQMAGLRNKRIWAEPIVIIFQGKSGTLPIDATNRSFFSSLPVTGQDGCSGSLRQRSAMDLQILNYVVTSNHIHLLVVDGDAEVVPQSLQLVAGKTAQEFNRIKNRKGAYWDDRYHATAVEPGGILSDFSPILI